MFGLLVAAVVAAAVYQKSRSKSTVGAGGPPGTIVDINPIMGHRQATIGLGQTVRVNLPTDWFQIEDVGVDPSAMPLQRVPARGLGGMTFTAAMPGRQKITFAKSGSLETITITFDVMPGYATGYRGYGFRPYGGFWERARMVDPNWRWRESQWRAVITAVRVVLPGVPLWLGPNWSWRGSPGYEFVRFWDALDFLGVDMYAPLAAHPDPTLPVAIAGWAPLVASLSAFSSAHDNKQFIFAEIGYASYADAAVDAPGCCTGAPGRAPALARWCGRHHPVAGSNLLLGSDWQW